MRGTNDKMKGLVRKVPERWRATTNSQTEAALDQTVEKDPQAGHRQAGARTDRPRTITHRMEE